VGGRVGVFVGTGVGDGVGVGVGVGVAVSVAGGSAVGVNVDETTGSALTDDCAAHAVSPLVSNISPNNPRRIRMCARPKSGRGYTRQHGMSRQLLRVTRRARRCVLGSLAIVACTTVTPQAAARRMQIRSRHDMQQ
jgi:hypothetical protein